MSLPDIHLDDRNFQDIVDDIKRRIALRCPDWTDHNVSDPGVTLIELFASMAEMTLYRLNRVPEKNYRKFLELVGISLESQKAAKVQLRFDLVRPLYDRDSDEFERIKRNLRADEVERIDREFLIRRYSDKQREENGPEYDPRSEEDRKIDEDWIRTMLATVPFAQRLFQEQTQSLARLETSAGTVRTETTDSIDFELLEDLVMVNPGLIHVHRADSPNDHATPPDEKNFEKHLGKGYQDRQRGFSIFGEEVSSGRCLYLGFQNEIAGNVIEIEVSCMRAAAEGQRPDYPNHVWEIRSDQKGAAQDRVGQKGGWVIIRPEMDSTRGFFNSGTIEFVLPSDLLKTTDGGSSAYWLRCRYTEDLEELGYEGTTVTSYKASPIVIDITASTIAGIGYGQHSQTVNLEVLGESDGTPGQIFQLKNAPCLDLDGSDVLLVGPPDQDPGSREIWTQVQDFSASDSTSRHFVFDALLGTVTLGPNIAQPDGSAIQHGAVPQKGLEVVMKTYRFGGGSRGNLRPHQVRVLRGAYANIRGVTNPTAASGGADLESLERAKMRAKHFLKIKERAVTAEDFEELTVKAPGSVARACCIQNDDQNRLKNKDYSPGNVHMFVVPLLPANVEVPTPRDLVVDPLKLEEIKSYLDQRRLLTTHLYVQPAGYLFVSLEATIVVQAGIDPEYAASRIRSRVNRFLHPTTGGMNGSGWPFGTKLTMADLYPQIASVEGVAFLLDAKLYESRANADGILGTEELVAADRGIHLEPHEVVVSRNHRLKIVGMTAGGIAPLANGERG